MIRCLSGRCRFVELVVSVRECGVNLIRLPKLLSTTARGGRHVSARSSGSIGPMEMLRTET
jgi:hypothetical protein